MQTLAGTAYPPGQHLLVDFWGAQHLDDLATIERALSEAAAACGATLLETRFHQFGNGGVTGMALLAESHISIHTWPETGYAAIDIFVCGGRDPQPAVEHLKTCFRPSHLDVKAISRGQ